MSNNLTELVDRFAGRDVLVLGEAMLDIYLSGTSARLCREAPVPIVTVDGRRDAPGGAANTAVNAHAFGARVRFLSAVGADPEGVRLRGLLQERGIETGELREDPTRRTLVKTRVSMASQLLLRFDQGTTGPVDPALEHALIDRLVELFPWSDAVVISDYGYGIVTPGVIAALAKLQRNHPRVVVADSKDLAAYREVGLTVVKPNYEEAVRLIGNPSIDRGSSRVEPDGRGGFEASRCDRVADRGGHAGQRGCADLRARSAPVSDLFPSGSALAGRGCRRYVSRGDGDGPGGRWRYHGRRGACLGCRLGRRRPGGNVVLFRR